MNERPLDKAQAITARYASTQMPSQRTGAPQQEHTDYHFIHTTLYKGTNPPACLELLEHWPGLSTKPSFAKGVQAAARARAERDTAATAPAATQ